MAVEPATTRLAGRTTRTVLTTRGAPATAAVPGAGLLVVTEPATGTVRHAHAARTAAVRRLRVRPRPRPTPTHSQEHR
ncbi:hypothetical protein ACF9IK_09180 [Kitasatospora hibisci]|uniref:hypothetical protein n=1 Tax=Kitasatospora hibisci TaxID=3369522 RepID=UPI003754170C